MKTQTFKTIVCLAAVFATAFPAGSQIVRIQFTSEVTDVSGPLLPGVGIGSTITGQVEVDLAHFPPDVSPSPDYVFHSYSGEGRPGYIFQFNAGLQTYTMDSVNAGKGLGLVPGVSLANYADSDGFDFAARDEGTLFGVVLRFWDYIEPETLLNGHYFPEDVNLAAGLGNSTFTYGDFINTNAVVAKVTSASMVIEQETPSALLIYRVKASSLPTHWKRALVASLKVADFAFAKGRCALGLKHLKHFQHKVGAQVGRKDPVLASHLLAGAQAIIDSGCAK